MRGPLKKAQLREQAEARLATSPYCPHLDHCWPQAAGWQCTFRCKQCHPMGPCAFIRVIPQSCGRVLQSKANSHLY